MSTTENIIGGKALDDLLQTLPAKVEKNIMRGALRSGANVILEEARRNAPVGPVSGTAKKKGAKPGDLLRSLRVSTRSRKGAVSASVKVGGSNKKTGATVFYAHMLEYGTRPHLIKAKPGSAMNVNGREVKYVNHPGISPRPFMRPAADNKFSESVEAVQAYVRKRLTKEGIEVPEQTPPDEAEQ